ncbi:MAG: hypothetical protein U0414_01505 [Polyangiaceae bacterium]
MKTAPLRIGTALVALGLLLGGSHLAGCSKYRVVKPPPTPTAVPTVAEVAPPPAPAAPVCEALHVDVPPLDDSEIAAPEVPLVDPTGKGMTWFYERLARVLRGRAKDHVRIGIYGDSNMTMDFIAGPIRRDLQTTYGDAGHGFIALARPWAHYHHMDVGQELSTAFESYAVTTKPTHDGAYGYAGIVSESPAPGSKVRISTAPESSPVGKSATRFDVFYLKGTKRGAFDLVIDGAKVASLDSEAPSRSVGIYRAEVPDGPHTFDVVIQSKNMKYVRFLGSAVERGAPGIVVDNLGVGAMSTRCIPMEDPKVSTPMLDYRRYDLVILMTGAADVLSMDTHEKVVREVIELHRKSRPNVSFLLVAPPDRGISHSTQNLLKLGKERAEMAETDGVGFWDLLAAEGGATSMEKFMRKSMALPDQIHFTDKGGAWIGRRLEHALLAGFAKYLEEHPDLGCDDPNQQELDPWPVGPHEPEAMATPAIAAK